MVGARKPAVTKAKKEAKRPVLYSTGAAAERLGLTQAKFRDLATAAGIVPAKTYPNPHHRSTKAFLWAPADVRKLGKRKAVRDALAAKDTPRPVRGTSYWDAVFTKRYGCPGAAVGDAAEALFEVNRYARTDACSKANTGEIHQLKREFIDLLVRMDRVDRVVRIAMSRPGKPCWGCGGTGDPTFGDDFDQGDGDDEYVDGGGTSGGPGSCSRCGGSRWYRAPRVDYLLAIHVTVEGRSYSWVVPRESFPDLRVDEESTTPPRVALDVGPLARPRTAERKALIRWVVLGHLGMVRPDVDAMLVAEPDVADAVASEETTSSGGP